MKPNIGRLNGKEIEFEDGSRETFDAVIYATGYRITFPFLDKAVFDPNTEAENLYRRMISLKHPGLVFAGLVQPVGPTIPLVELQGRWLAAVLSGKVALPDIAAQQREIRLHKKRQRETYLDSERYMLEVDFKTYARRMNSDMQSGAAGV
jgi:dimethylaniline monooxygenase (N-oxide forming)